MDTPWMVYILRCNDGTLYTGVTTDIERRVREHNESPKGAKYTRARRPVEMVYTETYSNRSKATAREAALKKLSKAEKQALITP